VIIVMHLEILSRIHTKTFFDGIFLLL